MKKNRKNERERFDVRRIKKNNGTTANASQRPSDFNSIQRHQNHWKIQTMSAYHKKIYTLCTNDAFFSVLLFSDMKIASFISLVCMRIYNVDDISFLFCFWRRNIWTFFLHFCTSFLVMVSMEWKRHFFDKKNYERKQKLLIRKGQLTQQFTMSRSCDIHMKQVILF